MGKQTEITAHIERLSFALKSSKEKFDRLMNNGHEFLELKKVLQEIKDLESQLQVYRKLADGS